MPAYDVLMTGPFADRLFRIAFALAGCYNLAFGLWAGLWPHSFFDLFDIETPRYPAIWACLGMVVGVYGFLYLHAAWRLETAWPIIAVGLLGKVLGPIGMALSFGDLWPRRLGMICVYNDLIWWLPFSLFLVRGTLLGGELARFAPSLCAAVHAVALVIMGIALRPGTLTEADAAARGAYIAENAALWAASWSVWMLAAMSLVGFYAWWGSHLTVGQAPPDGDPITAIRPAEPDLHVHPAGIAAVLIAAFGMVCDLSGEALSMLLLVERAPPTGSSTPVLWNAAAFTNVERAATLFTAGASNALYTLGGLVLMLATPDLPRWVRAAMWGTWLAGLAMSVAGVLNHVGGMVASTAVLFPLLIGWTAWMGARWRRA
jgi:hypothetical protein